MSDPNTEIASPQGPPARRQGTSSPWRRLARHLPPPWHTVLALTTGLLLALALPPADKGWLAWIALIPLLVALRDLPAVSGAMAGLYSGTVFFGLLLGYIRMFGFVPWAALVLFQSLFFATFGFLGSVMWRCPNPWIRVGALAASWSVNEVLRGNFGALAFTFGHLGYSQHRALCVLQLASLAGHYGIGFAIAALGAAVVEAVPRLRRASRPATGGPLVVAATLLLLALVWGAWRVRTYDPTHGHRLDVLAVQGNISVQPAGTDLAELCTEVYVRRSLADGRGADLIVWPETAVPIFLDNYPATLDRIRAVSRQLKAYLLVGAFESGPDAEILNTVWVYGPQGNALGKYHKRRLVIFGEYLPFRHIAERYLARWPIRDYDFTPGTCDLIMPVDGVRVAPLICFESTFPENSRWLVARGAQVLIMITSDAWVGDHPGEIAQHSQCSTLRAVETGRWLVRAAGTGVTYIVDPTGRVAAETPILEEGSARALVTAEDGFTFYQTVGLWPLVGVVCLLVLAGLADLWSVRARTGG